MVIMTCILFFGGIGFFIPRKYLSAYMLFASVCLSSLYLFYSPPKEYDLYRHYELLHILRKMDFRSVFMANIGGGNNWMLTEYVDSSQVYLIYAYILSQFRINGMLPAVTGVLIYGSISRIIMMAADDMGGEIEDWKISFAFFFLIAMMDFRAISGIRNMLAYALFAYVAYWDLVRKANKIWCLLAYVVIAGIHVSAYVLIAVRLLVAIDKSVLRWVLMAFMLMAYSFLDVIQAYMMRFAHIPLVTTLIGKINSYVIGGGSKYIMFRAALHFILIAIQAIIYIYVKIKLDMPPSFSQYGDFFLLFILFSFGAIRQYDIFVRSNMMVYFAVYPFLLFFLKEIVDRKPTELRLPESSMFGITEVCVYLMIFAAVLISLFMYYKSYYTPMDVGFHLRFV